MRLPATSSPGTRFLLDHFLSRSQGNSHVRASNKTAVGKNREKLQISTKNRYISETVEKICT